MSLESLGKVLIQMTNLLALDSPHFLSETDSGVEIIHLTMDDGTEKGKNGRSVYKVKLLSTLDCLAL